MLRLLVLLAAVVVLGGAAQSTDPLAEARALQRQGTLLYERSDYAAAEPLLRRAIELLERLLPADSSELADGLRTLAGLRSAQHRYGDAEALLRRVLAIRERTLPAAHPDLAVALDQLAASLYRQGRYAEAESLDRRALTIVEEALGSDHARTAHAANQLAMVLDAQGRHAEAEALYRRAIAAGEKSLGPGHPNVAYVVGNLANALAAQGRYDEAEALHRRALALREAALGMDHVDTAHSLNGLGLVFHNQGRFVDAEPFIRRALAIWERSLGPEHPDIAASLNNLAAMAEHRGRADEAETLHRRALAIREKALGRDHPEVAVSLNNLGQLLVVVRRFDEAETLLRRALAIHEKTLGPGHPNLRAALNNLAVAMREQGRFDEAEPLYRRALSIVEAAMGPGHPNTVPMLGNIAFMQFKQGQLRESLATMRRLGAVQRARILRGGDRGTSEERRAARATFSWHASLAHAASRASPGDDAALAGEAFEAAQWAQAGDVSGALARTAARFAAGTGRLAAIVREREDALDRRQALDRRLINSLASPPGRRDAADEARLRAAIAVADRKLAEADAILSAEFPRYADLTAGMPVPLAEAQSLLDDGEALVVYHVRDDETLLWILRRTRFDWGRLAVTRPMLAQAVRGMRDALDPTENPRLLPMPTKLAHLLHHALLPAAPGLLQARHLIVVADGPLQSLPFSALLTEPAPAEIQQHADHRRLAWLARRHAITVLPAVSSMRVLRQQAQRAGERQPFAGFGDPDLAGRSGTRRGLNAASLFRGAVADVAALRQLDPLPESADELRAIASSLKAPPDAVRLREAATETAVKTSDLSRHRVLAFATHGLMAGEFDDFAEPALVLTPPGIASEADDGLLSASEVAQLKLDADWVILSACNTAASDGTPGAEGLSGLAKSFFYAGARSLLVSHWYVNSEAAVRLSTGAVAALDRDPAIGRAEALRRSMVALLEDTGARPEMAHPMFWAPFVLVGEGGAGR